MLLIVSAIGSGGLVAYLVLQPIANSRIVEYRNRFQIVDFIALMVYVQVALVLGMGISDIYRLPSIVWVTMLSVMLWAIASVTAMQIGLVSSGKRLVLELVLAPATAVLIVFTAVAVPLVLGPLSVGVVDLNTLATGVGGLVAIAAATVGLRRIAGWLVKDLPKKPTFERKHATAKPLRDD